MRGSQEQLSLLCNLPYAETPYWYGATVRTLHLDVVRPRAGAPRPALVWFCGGAFQQMDWHLWIPDLIWYAQRGFTVASAEYRVGVPGRWPAALDDAWAAIAYLRRSAEKLCIDRSRIAVMGESAGGYLATCVGLGMRRPADCEPVQACVNLYGVSDVRRMEQFEAELRNSSIRDFLNGPAEEKDQVYRAADPQEHITSDAAPFLIVHGTKDRRVPPEQSRALHQKLMDKGVASQLILAEGAGHGDARLYTPSMKEKIRLFLAQTMLHE